MANDNVTRQQGVLDEWKHAVEDRRNGALAIDPVVLQQFAEGIEEHAIVRR